MSTTPDRKLSLTIGDTPVTLFMSFGLLDEVIKKFSTDNPVEGALLDNTNRMEIIKFMMEPRGKDKQFGMEKFDPDSEDFTKEDALKIHAFVMEHVTDFFLSSGEQAVTVFGKFAERAGSSTPSESGSPD